MPDTQSARPRCRSVALVGPYGSGKSTLFDAMLNAAGEPLKRGAATQGIAGGLRLANTSFMGDCWSILDCPGSVEFTHEAACALTAVDMAVVVCEPAPERAITAAPVLRMLDAQSIPYAIFINKIDTLPGRVRDTLAALQAHAKRKLVLRQVPVRDGEHITGYVDLVSERAYRYREAQPSEVVQIPAPMAARSEEARAGLLEVLADNDDALLEKILEDLAPSREEIYAHLHADLIAGRIAEVLLGASGHGQGIQRLWKALRHDAPSAAESAAARGIAPDGPPLAQIFKTVHAGHGGKVSYARIWRGTLTDGATIDGARIGGISRVVSGEARKGSDASAGEVVLLGRLDTVTTGAILGGDPGQAKLPFPEPPPSVHALALSTEDRKDDVKLSSALQKLLEEDPSLSLDHAETGETVLHGQGELHLRAAVDRLSSAWNVRVSTGRPHVPFKETIRRAVKQHGRLKRQTGGHGQFADVTLEIQPRQRGEGFLFVDKIVGGAVPRQYIPAVGDAAEQAMNKGPLGEPVVDVAVTLVDGGFHSVDSSDMAFRTATKSTIAEALAKADPVLLEPIDHVVVLVPNDATSRAQRLLTGRRGRILGFAEADDRPGWDAVEALVPQAELQDLIIELRSQTMGLGTYTRRFDHLAETAATHVQRG